MCFAYYITKITNTYWEYVILLFHSYNGCTIAPQCDVINTMPLLLND
jgi:hypothetical protein